MTATCRQKTKNDEYHTCSFCDFYIFGGLFGSLIAFLTSIGSLIKNTMVIYSHSK